MCVDFSREAPREPHCSSLLSLEPQDAGHSFPSPPPVRLRFCPGSTWAPTLLLAALKQGSTHQGPGPARGSAPSLCTSCAPHVKSLSTYSSSRRENNSNDKMS